MDPENDRRDGAASACEVSITESSEATFVALRGEIDIASVPLLQERVSALSGPRVVIDLSEVTFMDSSGIGALLRVRQELEGRAVAVTVRRPVDRVRRVIDLLGLADVLLDEAEEDAPS